MGGCLRQQVLHTWAYSEIHWPLSVKNIPHPVFSVEIGISFSIHDQYLLSIVCEAAPTPHYDVAHVLIRYRGDPARN